MKSFMFLHSSQQECEKINTASKAAPTHVSPPVSVTAHMLPQTSMHAYAQEMRGGACYQANQGQQGLFDQWRGPSGHWASTAYATAPTYRETNPPLYFTHMFNCTKQTDPRRGKKEKWQMCEWTSSKRLLRN